MTRVILALALLAALPAHADDSSGKNPFIASFPANNLASCVTFDDVFRICRDPKTIWIAPDVEPKDVAQKLIDAFAQIGFKVQ